MKTKKFKAKYDIPGCKAGTIIIASKHEKPIMLENAGWKYKYTDESICPYNCIEETKFFEEIAESKFKPGMCVVSHELIKIKLANGISRMISPYVKMFVINKPTAMPYVSVSYGGYEGIILEKYLHPAQEYFFVNSSGCVHSTILGKDPKTDDFRSSVGNIHDTREDAHTYINRMKRLATPL